MRKKHMPILLFMFAVLPVRILAVQDAGYSSTPSFFSLPDLVFDPLTYEYRFVEGELVRCTSADTTPLNATESYHLRRFSERICYDQVNELKERYTDLRRRTSALDSKKQFCTDFKNLIDVDNNYGPHCAAIGIGNNDQILEDFRSKCAGIRERQQNAEIEAQMSPGDYWSDDYSYNMWMTERNRVQRERFIDLASRFFDVSRQQQTLVMDVFAASNGQVDENTNGCLMHNRDTRFNCSDSRFGQIRDEFANRENCEGLSEREKKVCMMYKQNLTFGDDQRAMFERIAEASNLYIPEFLEQEQMSDPAVASTSFVYMVADGETSFLTGYRQNSSESEEETKHVQNMQLVHAMFARDITPGVEPVAYSDDDGPVDFANMNDDDRKQYLREHLQSENEISESNLDNFYRLMKSHLKGMKEQFEPRFRNMQMVRSILMNPNGAAPSDADVEAAHLQDRFSLTTAMNTEGSPSLGEAYKNIILEQARIKYGETNGVPNIPAEVDYEEDVRAIYMATVQVDRNQVQGQCENLISEDVAGFCTDLSNFQPILPSEEADYCLNMLMDPSANRQFLANVHNANYTEEQKETLEYHALGMACIIAQEKFLPGEENAQSRNYYEVSMKGGSVNAFRRTENEIGSSDSELINKQGEGNITPEQSNWRNGFNPDILPDFNNPYASNGSFSSELKPVNNLNGGATTPASLNGKGGSNQAAMAGIGAPTGSGLQGLGSVDAGTRTPASIVEDGSGNIEDSLDPNDLAERAYLQRITELKENLARLEGRLAGNAGASGADNAVNPELTALQQQIAAERAELERLRGELSDREAGVLTATNGSNVDVDVTIPRNGADPAAAPVAQPEEAAEEVAAATESFIGAPLSGGGGSGGGSGGAGDAYYDDYPLLLTANLEQYGDPIELFYNDIEGRIVTSVNPGLLTVNEPVYRELGDSRYLQYTLLENGEIEIKNVVLRNGLKQAVAEENTPAIEVYRGPVTRYNQFDDVLETKR